jgi:protein tyrosine phosphatase (PTP) superfamily phosphohydrolase (DUF442 family)
MAHRLAALLASFVIVSAQAADKPDNFVQWREGLASSAQPNAAWLARAKELKYDVIVNLAPPQSHGSIANEGGIVASKGVTYVNIPVDFNQPSAEDFRFFTETLKANTGRNVLVHCQVNLRGSSFTFLYRVIHEGAPMSESLAKLQGIWTPDKAWRKFIEDTLRANGKTVELF